MVSNPLRLNTRNKQRWLWQITALLLAWCVLSLSACHGHRHAHKHKHGPRQPVQDGRVLYQSPDRDEWQQPEQVLAALHLQRGQTVADLGSGTGYFTLPLARKVGVAAGTVYAVDIEPEMNKYVAEQAAEHYLYNIKAVLAEPMDPKLPESVDLIFSVNAYHHLENRANYFRNAAKYLKPGGRVAIIDFREGAFRHFTRKQVIIDDLTSAGYALVQDHDFLPRQNFLVFKRQ
jgi:SAM-dependent methyltransferase